jgi:hypothetical protein
MQDITETTFSIKNYFQSRIANFLISLFFNLLRSQSNRFFKNNSSYFHTRGRASQDLFVSLSSRTPSSKFNAPVIDEVIFSLATTAGITALKMCYFPSIV